MYPAHVLCIGSDSCIVDSKNGKAAGLIAKDVYEIVMANSEQLDSAIVYDRDFNYNL